MRIGIDLACWGNHRGYGRYTRNLLRALLASEAGRHHTYVGLADLATLAAADLPTNLEIITVPLSEAPTQAASADGRRKVSDLLRLSLAAWRARVDVLFFPSSYTYFPVLGGARPVVVIHDAIAERMPHLIFPHRAGRLAWTLKTRLACWQAQRVVTVSEAAAKAIRQHLPVRPDRVRIIPEAADPVFSPRVSGEDAAAGRAVRAKYGLPAGATVVLYVGGFGPHKNVAALVDAFAEMETKTERTEAKGLRTEESRVTAQSSVLSPQSSGIHLALVGQTEGEVFHSQHDALRARIRARGVLAQVTFTGFVPDEDLAHLYRESACLVLPSRDEGFGLPVVEAMACGTPVIASHAGALPELVRGGAGLLVDPDQPGALEDALRQVLFGDPAFARGLREAGLRRARELSWERAARDLVGVFDELNQAAQPARRDILEGTHA